MAEFERPKKLLGFTTKVNTGLGNLYITVNEDGTGNPIEVFATVGKSGKSTMAKTEAIGRLVSLNLRSGVSVNKIVEQLEDISGEHQLMDGDELIKSIPDAIAKTLKNEYVKEIE